MKVLLELHLRGKRKEVSSVSTLSSFVTGVGGQGPGRAGGVEKGRASGNRNLQTEAVRVCN